MSALEQTGAQGAQATGSAEQVAQLLAQRWIDAFNRSDPDALIALCSPQVKHEPSVLARGGGVYEGHAGIREWFADVARANFGYLASIGEVSVGASGDLLVFGDLMIEGEPVTPYSLRLRVRDGLVVETRTFLSDHDTMDSLHRFER